MTMKTLGLFIKKELHFVEDISRTSSHKISMEKV